MGVAEKIAKDREFLERKQKERSDMADSKILYYAGVGSRETPKDILVLMEQLANRLREDAFVLRTGHAPGADQAFERGAGAAAQIFLPWATFEQDVAFNASRDPEKPEVVNYPKIFDGPTAEAADIVYRIHPMWDSLKPGARKLHARNAHQILGPLPQSRPTPVEFVICWTPDAAIVGGTATAIKIAKERDIPVWNLADEDTYDMAFEWAWGD
jgi:hypothetical protein